MKNLILVLSISLLFSSCTNYICPTGHTTHQHKILKRFGNKKGYRKGYARNVRFRKSTGYAHPSVKEEARRVLRYRNMTKSIY